MVLSLLCTIIEGARVNTAKVYAKRALSAALDSTLAGYYAPLWSEYHIFALNTGSSDYNAVNTLLTQRVKDYMEYALDPYNEQKAASLIGEKGDMGLKLIDIDIDKLTLQSSAGLMDYEGQIFLNQAVEYMKYEEPGRGLELLLNKLSLLEQPVKISYIMEEKQKLEEELVEIDEEILVLMKLYDGIKTSKKGLELNKDGSLKTINTFIKKLCHADITMDGVGINNERIFQAQKNKYINPTTAYFIKINNGFKQIEYLRMNIYDLQSMISDLSKLITECEVKLNILNAKEKITAADKELIKDLQKRIKDYQASIYDMQSQIEYKEGIIKAEKDNISSLSSSLNQLLDELQPLHDDAIKSINIIIKKANAAAPLIDSYQELLNNSRDELSQEIYEGLEEELIQLKKYTSSETNSYDFTGMLQILERNKQVLTDVKLIIKGAGEALNKNDYIVASGMYATAQYRLSDYQIRGLSLDYSSLVYDKSNNRDVLDKVNAAVTSGLTALIIASEDISDADLNSTDNLPSFIHALSDEKSDFTDVIKTFFKNAMPGDKSSKAGALFGNFNKETDIKDMLREGINKLAEQVLFREYLDKHFSSYQPKTAPTQVKPSSIKYEQEYLTIGKYSDADNLSAIITRIIMFRMIFDFISVLSDKNIRNEAKLIASGLVGFTGLPILVRITQLLIMLIWSFAEALLDTTALIMGKEIPIIKKQVVMTFPEIFMLTREQLRKKADSLQEPKELSLNYNGYLKIFLLMTTKEKLAYRAMDLIQENLKVRYKDDEFKISNCLYGFEISAQFETERRFTGLKFLQKYYDSGQNSYHFSAVAADSY